MRLCMKLTGLKTRDIRVLFNCFRIDYADVPFTNVVYRIRGYCVYEDLPNSYSLMPPDVSLVPIFSQVFFLILIFII